MPALALVSHHQPVQPVRPDPELLAYKAPFVVQKLLMNKTVASAEEGERLFEEVKRYLWITRFHREQTYSMSSLRVDEAWHQFVLFTREYFEFSLRFFGRYVDHEPSNARPEGSPPHASWDRFVELYTAAFGEPPSDLWRDETSVIPERRVIRNIQDLQVRLEGDRAALLWGERVVVRVDTRGEAALRFIARHPIFYVRELPGLAARDKVALCRALVGSHVLRVAP